MPATKVPDRFFDKTFFRGTVSINAGQSATVTHALNLPVAQDVIVSLIRPDNIGVSDYTITSYGVNSLVINIPSYYPTGTYTVRVLTGFL